MAVSRRTIVGPAVAALLVVGCAAAPPAPPSPLAPFVGTWRGTQGATVHAVYFIDEREGRLRARSEYRIVEPGQPAGAGRRVEGEVAGIRVDGRAITFSVVYEGGGAPVDRSMAIYDLVADGDTLRGRGQNLRTNAAFDVSLRRMR